jgi:hypothetical protein
MTKQFVRLIGGPNAGAIEKVDHDQLQIVKTTPMPAMAVHPSHRNFGLSAQTVTLQQTLYTRRVLYCCSRESRLFYFAPESMSDLEALQSVLGP